MLLRDGPERLEEKIKAQLNGWRSATVNIAIIGKSGSGKSSFINAFLGLDEDLDEGAAETGCTETTMEPTHYLVPNKPNLKLWDVPGIGGVKHQDRDNYLEKIKLETYDGFILMTSKRLYEEDCWLAKTIHLASRSLFLVRSKVDEDVSAYKRKFKNRKSYAECLKLVKEAISKELTENLAQEGFVRDQKFYLIDNLEPENTDFDFQMLLEDILASLNDIQREVVAFNIKTCKQSKHQA